MTTLIKHPIWSWVIASKILSYVYKHFWEAWMYVGGHATIQTITIFFYLIRSLLHVNSCTEILVNHHYSHKSGRWKKKNHTANLLFLQWLDVASGGFCECAAWPAHKDANEISFNLWWFVCVCVRTWVRAHVLESAHKCDHSTAYLCVWVLHASLHISKQACLLIYVVE